MGVLEAIRYTNADRPQLEILDQLQLPHTSHYDRILTAEDGWQAIRHMRTRGAPAIAIVAALSLAVELGGSASKIGGSASEARDFVRERLRFLVTSRPTAVNLEDAAGKLGRVVDQVAGVEGANGEAVAEAYIRAAEVMLRKDVEDNEAIGRHGAQWIAKNAGHTRKVNVITHCNTGSLATAGYGTALGVIRSLNGTSLLEHAYCTETRPYNQGSRLTAYELMHDKIPSTLITDSMSAALMNTKRGTSGAIDAVIVGADRVVANGDTANKIGTYSLAVLAKHHGAKFIVAAPLTSIDLGKTSGEEITIEYRPDRELTLVKGPLFEDAAVVSGTSKAVSMAPEGVQVWNPAFDVTPAGLIDAIVTEVGVIERDVATGAFDMKSLFK